MFKLLQECSLPSRNFGELNAHLVVVNLQNTHTNFNIVLNVAKKVIGAAERVLYFVLVSSDFELKVFFLQVVYQGLLDHVGVVRREKLSIIVKNTLILFKILLWLIQLVIDIEFGLLDLTQNLLSHVSLKQSSFSIVHSLLLFIFLSLCLFFENLLDLILSLSKAV